MYKKKKRAGFLFHRQKAKNMGNPSAGVVMPGSLHTRFWATDDNRKCAVFLFNLSSHNHIYIVSIFSLEETISLKIRERPQSWRAKCSLQVSVRG